MLFLAMSDGSAKNGCGGAGFVSCVLSVYHRIDHRVLIKHEMSNERRELKVQPKQRKQQSFIGESVLWMSMVLWCTWCGSRHTEGTR